ncbi:MAG: hypothetical protein HY786_02110 [Deltaproteobacteria bacterium]|nr:hypothetical protein [Deltaproteobacteria bacterium]
MAEGTIESVTGSTLIMKGVEDWQPLKEADAITDGVLLWIGPSSSLVLKVGDKLIELSGGPVGSNIMINKVEPFDAAINGVGIRYLAAQMPPASPPQLLSPPEGIRLTNGTIELSWSSSQKELLYHIQISDTPDFNKLVLDEKSYNSETKIIDKLEKGKFYWRVSSLDKEGIEGGFSDIRTFEVKPLPAPPSVGSPASTKTSTTVRWKRRSDEEKYHLQISRDKDFSEISVDLMNVEGPRVTVGTLEEGDYFVRVSAADEEGSEGRFSDPQQFYVGPKVPSSNIAPVMIILGVAFMLLGGP